MQDHQPTPQETAITLAVSAAALLTLLALGSVTPDFLLALLR